MKPFLSLFILFTGVALLLLATGCATTKHTETYLTAAGFKMVSATTPSQLQKLKSLPPGKITLTKRNGKTYYVYPDVPNSRMYLGTVKEYQEYQQIAAYSKIAAQDRDTYEMAPVNGADWDDWDSWDVVIISPN